MSEIQVQKNMAESDGKYLEEKTEGMKANFQAKMDDFKQIMESLQADVVIPKKNVLQGCFFVNADVGPKVQVPKSKVFNRNRNAKELENFLWDMEQVLQGFSCP